MEIVAIDEWARFSTHIFQLFHAKVVFGQGKNGSGSAAKRKKKNK